MAINISASTFKKVLEYLHHQASVGDLQAEKLLKLLPSSEQAPDFIKKLFDAWQELADLQIGQSSENCWSYPVPLGDIAENLSISIETLIQYLESSEDRDLQLLPARGENYVVKSQQVGDLTFHSAPSLTPKSSKPETGKASPEVTFKVGDRILIKNRPQYENQAGIVDQVLSVSCRIKLDNGWIAFLPNQCLEIKN